jgi:hypothetical protein
LRPRYRCERLCDALEKEEEHGLDAARTLPPHLSRVPLQRARRFVEVPVDVRLVAHDVAVDEGVVELGGAAELRQCQPHNKGDFGLVVEREPRHEAVAEELENLSAMRGGKGGGGVAPN